MKQSYVPVQNYFPSLHAETVDPPAIGNARESDRNYRDPDGHYHYFRYLSSDSNKVHTI